MLSSKLQLAFQMSPLPSDAAGSAAHVFITVLQPSVSVASVCEADSCFVGDCTPRADQGLPGAWPRPCGGEAESLRACKRASVYVCMRPSSTPHLVTAEGNRPPRHRDLCVVFSSLFASGRPPPAHLLDPSSPRLLLLFEVVTQQCPCGCLSSFSASLRLIEQKHVLASDASNHILSDHREGD